MDVADLAPMMLTVFPTMDLSHWDATLFALLLELMLEFALIPTSAWLTLMITLTAFLTPARLTARLISLAKLARVMLTVVFLTEEVCLGNLNATLPLVLADLARLMLIAQVPLLTVGQTEDAMLAHNFLLAHSVVPLMVVKFLTNPIAILSLTFA